MKFDFKNLGPIKQGQVELGDLTVICGRNNVGKTYLSHSIWGFLNSFSNLVEVDIDNLSEISEETQSMVVNFNQINISLKLKQQSEKYSAEGLQAIFNTDVDFLKDAAVNLHMFKTTGENGTVDLCLDEDILSDIFLVQSFSNQTVLNSGLKITVNKNDGDGFFEFGFELIEQKSNLFENSKITFEEYILRMIGVMVIGWIERTIFPNTRIITSERTGIALFLPSLDHKASEIARSLSTNKQTYGLGSLLDSTKKEAGLYPTYGDPIQDNIDRIRASSSQKQTSELFTDNPQIATILSDLIGGSFESGSNGITFTTNDKQAVPLHVVSSSAKSLFLIEHYIKREAKAGDLLIIDEPELNLHLDNQVKMAHLIAALINAGVKILITTHSDHLLRELNNLIMLSSAKISPQKQAELMEAYQIAKEFQLQPEQVKAFVVSQEQNEVFDMPVSETGIKMDLFNQEINQHNRQTKDIYFALQNAL